MIFRYCSIAIWWLISYNNLFQLILCLFTIMAANWWTAFLTTKFLRVKLQWYQAMKWLFCFSFNCTKVETLPLGQTFVSKLPIKILNICLSIRLYTMHQKWIRKLLDFNLSYANISCLLNKPSVSLRLCLNTKFTIQIGLKCLQIDYLGHPISTEKVRAYPNKLKSKRGWPFQLKLYGFKTWRI